MQNALSKTLLLGVAYSLIFLKGGVNTVAAEAPVYPEKSATTLGTAGTDFTLNGRPSFLFGLSYYGGLGASEEAIGKDLAEEKKNGFNWGRVWATGSAFE